jgi:glycosyltransferase involved in cell wall biosynthesis
MRLLEVAPMVSAIDERAVQLGGAQVLFADLARGLAARGHEVWVAAAEGSSLAGTRVLPLAIDSRAMRPADLRRTVGERADADAQAAAFRRVRAWLDEHGGDVDAVHAHAYDAPAFDSLAGSPVPVVHTLHLPPNDQGVVRAAREARRHGAMLVTVSEWNARAWREAGADVARVIPNGVDAGAAPQGTTRGAHLLHAGRISPEKGVEDAIVVAERTGHPLLVVGGIYDDAYFRKAIAPRVRRDEGWAAGYAVEGALYVGPRPREEVRRIMAGAAATLMPVKWDEAFGLVAVESLAAGTPVAAYRRGGLAEIVDEASGALAEPDDLDDLGRAVRRALTRRHDACRRRAERFSLERMVTGYEDLLREVMAGRIR